MNSSSVNVGIEFRPRKPTKYKPLQKVSDFSIINILKKANRFEFSNIEIAELCEKFAIDESHIRCLVSSAKRAKEGGY